MNKIASLLVFLSLTSCAFFLYFYAHKKNIKNLDERPSYLDYDSKVVKGGDDYINGIRLKKISKEVDGKAVDITVVSVDTSKLVKGIGISSPAIISKIDGDNISGLTLKEYQKLGKYKIVQSGGFLTSWAPPYPLGYVKIQGTEYNRVHNSWLTTGTFCTDGKKFSIFRLQNNGQFLNWPSCVQAGPMTIENGKNVLDTRKNTEFVTKFSHRQSFLCEKADGILLMGVAENVKLSHLSQVMVKSEASGGLGCKNAVTLMGKGMSGILIIDKTHAVPIGNVDAPLPYAIVVK